MNKRYSSNGWDNYKYGESRPCTHVWRFLYTSHGVEVFECTKAGCGQHKRFEN